MCTTALKTYRDCPYRKPGCQTLPYHGPGQSTTRGLSHTSYCKINGQFSIENHHVSGAILHSLCIFNGKLKKITVDHLYCNLLRVAQPVHSRFICVVVERSQEDCRSRWVEHVRVIELIRHNIVRESLAVRQRERERERERDLSSTGMYIQ